MQKCKDMPYKTDKREEVVSLCGLRCPLPTLKVRRLLAALPPGACLVVDVDDPHAPVDLRRFCQLGGHILQSAQPKTGGVVRVSLRKSGA